MNLPLQACVVLDNKSVYYGFLYMQNERIVVLLNNLVDNAELGPLQNIRREHIEPEADILILPRRQVNTIKILENIL